MQKLKYIAILFSFIAFASWGQNEATKWYFGSFAGLNFSTNPPSALTNGSLTSPEGCASIADANGNLLFYTNSLSIFNANHTTMANGIGLIGGTSTSQAAIIIKRPSSLTNYFVFHLTAGIGTLYYSEVDMSLAAGAGSVIAKNVLVASSLREQLCAVKHANGLDYWVMVHDLTSNTFRAFLVTSAGVNTTPVNSVVGTTLNSSAVGCMKFSPNGAKLAHALTSPLVELFDFNAATGVVSNPLIMNNAPVVAYGVEFSPDGTKLYAKGSPNLIQWNLCAGSPSLVATSATTLITSSNSVGSLQLAPNGRIYVSLWGLQSLGVINNPNLAGTACNYVDQGQSIAPRFASAGLPNFVSSSFKPPLAPFTFTVSNAFGCQTAGFSAPTGVFTGTTPVCAFAGFSISAFQWNFGDPTSGAANTSTLNSPSHYFTSTGTFTVQLVVSFSNGGGSDTLRQVVNIVQPCPVITNTNISCSTLGSATISIGGGTLPYSYTWMPTAQVGSVASNLYPGTYTITCFDITNNASFTVATTFTSAQVFSTTLQNTSLLACNSINNGTASAIVTGGSASQNYFWSNGSYTQTAATATALGIGIHSVTITDALTFCSSSHTFLISQPPLLVGTISAASPTACAGSSIQLNFTATGGTGAYTYTWSSAGTASSAIATQTQAGVFGYTAEVRDNNNCTDTKTISVSFIANPLLSVNAATICAGETTTLTVNGASSYTWLPGAFSASSLVLTPLSSGNYTISGMSLGCITTVTTSITVLPIPTLSFSTFSITCASLGSATVTAGGAVGPYSYTWAPVMQTSSVATNLNPGAYTLTVLDAGTGCTSVGSTTFTSLVPLSGDLVNTNSLTCFGASNATAAIQNINGGSANQNYAWSNGTVTYTTPSPSNLSAGTWSINLTDALTGCLVYSVFTITQPLPLTVTISANSTSVCANDLISFTTNVSGGTLPYTYSWTGGSSLNTATYSIGTAGIFSSSLVVNDFYLCEAVEVATIDVVPNPTVSVASASICPLNIGTLTAAGASTYTWYATTFSTTGSTFTNSPVGSSVYSVLGSALSCTATSTGTIFVYPLPIAQNQLSSPRCEGGTTNLNAGGGVSYLWQGPQSFSSAASSISLTGLQLNQSGVYSVTVTSVNGCTAAASNTLVVNPTPTISAAGSTVCSSQTLSLTANSLPGASYLWTGPQGFLSSMQNPSLPNPSLSSSGIYYVMVSSVQGCTAVTSATASVIAPPSVSIALSSESICSQSFNGSNNSVTVNASGANSYTIYPPQQFGGAAIFGSNAVLVVQAPYMPSIINTAITVEGSNGICSVPSTVTISVVPNPTVNLSAATLSFCAGQSTTISSSGAASYFWTGSSTSYTPSFGGGSIVVGPKNNATFSVYGASLACNSALETISVAVVPLPTFSISAVSNSICLFESTNLLVAGTASSYNWLPAQGIGVYSGTNVVASPTLSQTYTVIASANSCTNSATVSVGVWTLPVPRIEVYTPKVCKDSEIRLAAFGGASYQWLGPANFSTTGQQLSFIASSTLLGGVYTVTVIDANSCRSSSTAVVEVLPLPEGGFKNIKEEFCSPSCSRFEFVGVGADQNLLSTWEINKQSFSGTRFQYCFIEPGTYTLSGKFTDRLSGCSNTARYLLNARPQPTADFDYLPQQPIEGTDEVVFENLSKGSGLSTFNWFFNDNEGYTTDSKNAKFTYSEPGNFRVAMVVKNEWQCADTAIKIINVQPDFSVYVPAAFTPNGDNLNDMFLPKVRSAKLYSLRIYDRWGKELFYSLDPETGWDGSCSGALCKQDVYQWIIELSTSFGEKKILKGNVSLLK